MNIVTPGTGKVPLHYMAITAQTDIVEKLLLAGADPNILDDDGLTPLTVGYNWGFDMNLNLTFSFLMRFTFYV